MSIPVAVLTVKERGRLLAPFLRRAAAALFSYGPPNMSKAGPLDLLWILGFVVAAIVVGTILIMRDKG